MNRCKECCCIVPSYRMKWFQLLTIAALFATGFMLFVTGVVAHSGYLALISLVPLLLSLAPIFICGPPHPFQTYPSAFTLAYDTDDPECLKDYGYFITGFLIVASGATILILAHLEKITIGTAGFALMGQIIVLSAVLLYLVFFHMPRTEEEQEDAEI